MSTNVSTIQDNPSAISSSSDYIDMDTMESWCRRFTCSSFTEVCSRLNYSQLSQVHAELRSREGRISTQLENRPTGDPDWKMRTGSALAIIKNKAGIVSTRLSAIRNNHISITLSKMGGLSETTSHRLALIKCLIHMIDHHANTTRMSTEEKSVLDACRTVGGVADESKYDGMKYNVIQHSITSSDNVEIAQITASGFLAEEYGFLLASSEDMEEMLHRLEPLIAYMAGKSRCNDEMHDSTKCVHCQSQQAHGDLVGLLAEIK